MCVPAIFYNLQRLLSQPVSSSSGDFSGKSPRPKRLANSLNVSTLDDSSDAQHKDKRWEKHCLNSWKTENKCSETGPCATSPFAPLLRTDSFLLLIRYSTLAVRTVSAAPPPPPSSSFAAVSKLDLPADLSWPASFIWSSEGSRQRGAGL